MGKISTKEYLSKISSDCYSKSSPYKFSKKPDLMGLGTDKYRKGVVSVLDWASELCYYYLGQDEALKAEFEKQIRKKKQELIPTLYNNEYRSGVEKGFKFVEEMIKDQKL